MSTYEKRNVCVKSKCCSIYQNVVDICEEVVKFMDEWPKYENRDCFYV